MKNQKPFTGILVDVFNHFVEEYGMGEKYEMELNNYLNKCTVAPIKILTLVENRDEKNKACLCLHNDDKGHSIVFCSAMPNKTGDLVDPLIEIRQNLRTEKLLVIPKEEAGEGIPRINVLNNSPDQRAKRVRKIALELHGCAIDFTTSGNYGGEEFSQNGAGQNGKLEKVPAT